MAPIELKERDLWFASSKCVLLSTVRCHEVHAVTSIGNFVAVLPYGLLILGSAISRFSWNYRALSTICQLVLDCTLWNCIWP